MKIKSKGVLIRVVKMIDDYLERQKLLDEIFSFISFIFINAEILFNSKNHKQTTFKLTYKLNIDENIISLEYCIRWYHFHEKSLLRKNALLFSKVNRKVYEVSAVLD